MINCPGVERNRQEADDKKISCCLATGLDRPSNTLSAGWVSRSLWLSNSLLRLGVLNIKSLDHFSLGDGAGLLCGRVPAGGTALPAATADTSCGRAQLPASTPTRSRPRRLAQAGSPQLWAVPGAAAAHGVSGWQDLSPPSSEKGSSCSLLLRFTPPRGSAATNTREGQSQARKMQYREKSPRLL